MKWVTVFLCLLSSLANAAIQIIDTRTEKFVSSVAPLREFNIEVYKKKVTFAGEPEMDANFMTDLRVVLKTDSVSDIEKFGVVQFIRGCKFESEKVGNVLTKRTTISREHFGQIRVFKHKTWEVDTDSFDPIYHSYDKNRFALWRWNSDPESLSPETSTYYLKKLPPHPVVFFTDLPGTSARFPNATRAVAHNSSLEFKVCLFKISDLPLETDFTGSNIDLNNAVACHGWDDKFVFNFQTNKMDRPTDIDSICEVGLKKKKLLDR